MDFNQDTEFVIQRFHTAVTNNFCVFDKRCGPPHKENFQFSSFLPTFTEFLVQKYLLPAFQNTKLLLF